MRWIAVVVAMAGPVAAHAVDQVSVGVASGESVDMAQVAVGGRIGRDPLWSGEVWHLEARWDVSFGMWTAGRQGGDRKALIDFGATPSLRLERRGEHLSPFIEGGIGIHYLSDTVDASHAQLSTRFQFGDYVGVGARFGRDGQYAISARFVHYSNGGIHKPNRGADMGMINFAYRF